MKPKFITLFTFITALTLAGINTARAADFTFIVPVKLNNLRPEVTKYQVVCQVGAGALTAGGLAGMIGSSAKTFPVDVNSGNVANSVTIEFNVHPDSDPSQAVNYSCHVRLEAGGINASPTTATAASVEIWRKPKSGTPFTPVVSGTIPP